MRTTLVQPPSLRFDAHELTPPLGLLMLAAVLEQQSIDVVVVDLNLLGLQDPSWGGGDIYATALDVILSTSPDVVGFTSMALESHVCLELARRLKLLDPLVVTVLGGPHFSAIAEQVLNHYSWIDFVVTGEGELAVEELCTALRANRSPDTSANLARRTASGSIRIERVFKPQPRLDTLPSPAYHLIDFEHYFARNPLRMASFEHARGCALRCEFCYSPVHWGQGEQRLAIENTQREIVRLAGFGVRHLFFVSDNFVNSKTLAKQLSWAIAELDLDITWNCYATLPQLTDDTLDAMATAGCTAVFIGVDAVTSKSKKQFKKHYFKHWQQLSDRLTNCTGRGITPTCAFLVEPPIPDTALTDQTLAIATFAQTLGCGVRLNPLTVYNRTGLDKDSRESDCYYSTAKPKLLFDTHEVNEDNDLAREHPALFPCHNATFDPAYDLEFCSGLYTAFTILQEYPRAAARYALDLNKSLWQLFSTVAERTGSILEVPPLKRRAQVRDTFKRYAEQAPGLEHLRSVMELEAAESELAASAKPEALVLHLDDYQAPVSIQPYRLVSLGIALDEVLAYTPVVRQEGDESQYLIVRNSESLEYFKVPQLIAQALPCFENISDALNRSPALILKGDRTFSLPKFLERLGILTTKDDVIEEMTT